MTTKHRRRDLTVGLRHKDVGLVVHAKQKNRQQRHAPLEPCPACGAPAMADAFYDGDPEWDDPRRCQRCGTL